MSRNHVIAHPSHVVPNAYGFPYMAPEQFDDEWTYPWAYPVDAGQISPWEFAHTNPNAMEWPVHYDPNSMGHYPAGHDSYLPHHYTGAPPSADAPDWLHKAYSAAQDAAQAIGQGFSHMPGLGQALGQGIARAPSISSVFGGPAAALSRAADVGDKASTAADTVKLQANQVGDDARRTLANVNQHVEDAARQAQETGKTVQYVVIGVGALAAVAILFHIVKQSTE